MKYGSLAVWSTQGMEKSHYAAKTAYMKHSQHDGTAQHNSSILQVFQWWYRVIQHREHKKVKDKQFENNPLVIATRTLAANRREASLTSCAVQRWTEWRNTCQRNGSRFVPLLAPTLEEDAT